MATRWNGLALKSGEPGDEVYGTLLVHIAAQARARGPHYFHLEMHAPPDARGRESTAQEMRGYGASLEEFHLRRPPSRYPWRNRGRQFSTSA
ncbi:MAG: CRISPR-associated protein Csx16 [Burkholderiales bacterium]